MRATSSIHVMITLVVNCAADERGAGRRGGNLLAQRSRLGSAVAAYLLAGPE